MRPVLDTAAVSLDACCKMHDLLCHNNSNVRDGEKGQGYFA